MGVVSFGVWYLAAVALRPVAVSGFGRLPAGEAKERFLQFLADGLTVAQAAARVGRTVKGVEYWRQKDVEFAERFDFIRAARSGGVGRPPVPDFPEFCVEYLGFDRFYWHQYQWFDVLEGREPRGLHPAQRFVRGRPNRVIILTPPNHAKTTTVTIAYTVWRVCKNPNEHVTLVSKTATRAREFLHAIKRYLSHPTYARLQRDFGPLEGWQRSADAWTKTQITLSSEDSDAAKDPTVQVLGVGGQIYGVRSNLVILDDVVDLTNVNQFDQQVNWFAQEVLSRPGQVTGQIVVIGTRVGSVDFYSELMDRFEGVYTVFASPAVLEYADDPADWRVLWPERPDTSPLALAAIREQLPAATWARAYQQESVAEDALFPAQVVQAVLDRRPRGALSEEARPGGMRGLVVVAGLDPATTGFTAAVVVAVDRVSKKRWLLDAFNERDVTPARMREMVKTFTRQYGIVEWRVERNAFQRFLTQDEELRQWLAQQGCVLREHYTTGQLKWDADFGVESLESLFVGALDGRALISIPHPSGQGCGVFGRLVEQLIGWAPQSKAPCDLVMALWFADLKARELCRDGVSSKTHFRRGGFMTRAAVRRQQVVNLVEARFAGGEVEEAG
ncbi:MAG: hypothetical protein IRZ06_10195 [Nevskia sp.]|nr:hypothetical protein [Nevskia sp.]